MFVHIGKWLPQGYSPISKHLGSNLLIHTQINSYIGKDIGNCASLTGIQFDDSLNLYICETTSNIPDVCICNVG